MAFGLITDSIYLFLFEGRLVVLGFLSLSLSFGSLFFLLFLVKNGEGHSGEQKPLLACKSERVLGSLRVDSDVSVAVLMPCSDLLVPVVPGASGPIRVCAMSHPTLFYFLLRLPLCSLKSDMALCSRCVYSLPVTFSITTVCMSPW